jgi:hypothetical protein
VRRERCAPLLLALEDVSMRLYVWEGNGISRATGDDGTLVVLASCVNDARRTVRRAREQRLARLERLTALVRRGRDSDQGRRARIELADLMDRRFWDGSDGALERDPDKVMDTDGEGIVAFNGGSYV